jgi:heme/copper-type cytochrome/quinol oxidase subunit 4
MRSRFASPDRNVVLRVGLGVLAALDVLTGGWALIFPGSFYRDFPGLGMHWVAAAPPFNEHLLTDFGGALLGIAVALALAALIGERRLVQVVLLAALVQAVPHLIYHLTHWDMLPVGQVVVSRFSLAVPVVLALGLLWLTRHGSDRQAARSARETASPPSATEPTR